MWLLLFLLVLAVGVIAAAYFLWKLSISGIYYSKSANVEKYIQFNDAKLKQQYGSKQMPMETLIEAYFDEKIEIKGDLYETLQNRDLFANYSLTGNHFKFLLAHFLPETLIHSKAEDQRMVRWHYDRGDDFFNWFLGTRMVYTSAYFKTLDGSEGLEAAQDQKMDLVCKKMNLQKGESHLDIGCGWGTLCLHAAKNFGSDSTGVTLSKNQTAFGNNRIKDAGLENKAKILCSDYRDIPTAKWDKISCLEMVEHVGVKNVPKFMSQVYSLLKDDGIFVMQYCGLRRAWQWRDIIWGLFMAKYIFPGADASTPLAFMVDKMEKAGFEIKSVETITWHYSMTIYLWYKNWIQNKKEIVNKYGERWYRIWVIFLAWSSLIAKEGTSACFQMVAHKNLTEFDRSVFVKNKASAF